MGIRILKGRDIESRDSPNALPVVMINGTSDPVVPHGGGT